MITTEKLQTSLISAIVEIPKYAIWGFLCGYIYSKLTDLPANRVFKYWVINDIVVGFVNNMTTSFVKDEVIKDLTTRTIRVIGSMVFIYQMCKNDLMNDKIKYMLIVMNTIIFCANLLLTAGFLKKKFENPSELYTDYWSVFLILMFENFYNVPSKQPPVFPLTPLTLFPASGSVPDVADQSGLKIY